MKKTAFGLILPGVLILAFLLPGCGGGTRETTVGTTVDGIVIEKTIHGELQTTSRLLGLPVDEDTFWRFGYALYERVDEAARAAGLEYGQPSYFEYRLPDTWDEAAEDSAERYLAHRLRESASAGFDFSALAGEDVAGCLWVYASDGRSRVYIGICGPDGAIRGLWEDEFRPADGEESWNHWSALELELTEWNTFTPD
ncbi:MAG: hypothetical protein KBA30_05020 [Clostridia bacterium]|nr:hypothetical protein [Clostridia bacterium]